MRTIEVNGQSFDVRPLKRGEVKQLRKAGFNLVALDPPTAEDAMDAVFELIFTPDQISAIDALDNPDALKVWSAVLVETYGSRGEEKN